MCIPFTHVWKVTSVTPFRPREALWTYRCTKCPATKGRIRKG